MNSIIYDSVIYLNLFYNKIERIFTSYGNYSKSRSSFLSKNNTRILKTSCEMAT